MSVSHSKRDTVEKLLLSSMLMNSQKNTTNNSLPTSITATSAAAMSSLLFSIEQWELIRRLRNSGISKEDIIQAFDELDRIERDLGSIYDIPMAKPSSGSTTQNNSAGNKQNELFAKNFQMLLSQAATTNNNHHHHHHQKLASSIVGVNKASSNDLSNTTSHLLGSSDATTTGTSGSSAAMTQNANNLVNAYFSNLIDSDAENKAIEEFRSKGEVAIHSEISFFVYKHDLKQSQIARMAGVNQAYVSKFLRGEFFDLSENGKTLIYRWYLRFLKHPNIYLQAHNITLTSNDHISKAPKLEVSDINSPNLPVASFTNVTNTSYDQPKRTRFSFKTEHLLILEKAFLENQYPDQKRREDIARACNEARPCTEREKVTEQIITHWFQNKRKISRKANCEDQSSPSNALNGGGHMMQNGSSSSAMNNEDEEDEDEDGQEEGNELSPDYQNSCSPINYPDYVDEHPPAAPQPTNYATNKSIHNMGHHNAIQSGKSNEDSDNEELDNEEITFET